MKYITRYAEIKEPRMKRAKVETEKYSDMTLSELYSNSTFQRDFIRRYINDLPRMCFELFRVKLTSQQHEVMTAHDFMQGRTIVASGHGTGKTKQIGLLSACFMLLFPYSIVRIQAPMLKQVTSFSFKEIRDAFQRLSEPYRVEDGTIRRNKWHFLADTMQFNVEKIYSKKNPTSWYTEAKTAPKGKSENLSGQHKWAYLLIFDEMSGISDEMIVASLGALSNKINSCIGFSQHTRLNGLFHDFMTVVEGWHRIILSSEDSEIVSETAIENWRQTYTENEYRVRVLGLEPLFTSGNLITPQEAHALFDRKAWVDEFQAVGMIISVDVAYRGIRNNSVITKIRVGSCGKLIVTSFHVTALKPIATAKEAFKQGVMEKKNHGKVVICIDATAGGAEAGEELLNMVDTADIEGLEAIDIVWGSGRLSVGEKRLYRNQRAKAYAMLQTDAMEGNTYIADRSQLTRTTRELSNIPFSYQGDDFILKIASKDEMEIESPDIADTLAQAQLVKEEFTDLFTTEP